MESSGEQSHFVKRVVLSSGKTIEVVYFKDADTASGATSSEGAANVAPSAGPGESAPDLHECRDCSSGLVQPVSWEEASPSSWRVTLSCPNCGIAREGTFDQETVEAYDEHLDRGSDALAADYRRLVRANMADEIDRMVAALEADALLPMDF